MKLWKLGAAGLAGYWLYKRGVFAYNKDTKQFSVNLSALSAAGVSAGQTLTNYGVATAQTVQSQVAAQAPAIVDQVSQAVSPLIPLATPAPQTTLTIQPKITLNPLVSPVSAFSQLLSGLGCGMGEDWGKQMVAWR